MEAIRVKFCEDAPQQTPPSQHQNGPKGRPQVSRCLTLAVRADARPSLPGASRACCFPAAGCPCKSWRSAWEKQRNLRFYHDACEEYVDSGCGGADGGKLCFCCGPAGCPQDGTVQGTLFG
ncbi:hypothetical protein E2C01_065662 [Portunus trituberculatus]|uniref:Uncharacterized protein n=1 Tax=Portunus trituberculatus TaxID=210409 RepID=A0A5B7HP05_PORTR|nr:hypothetical protein [Portunus trituberculatus]